MAASIGQTLRVRLGAARAALSSVSDDARRMISHTQSRAVIELAARCPGLPSLSAEDRACLQDIAMGTLWEDADQKAVLECLREPQQTPFAERPHKQVQQHFAPAFLSYFRAWEWDQLASPEVATTEKEGMVLARLVALSAQSLSEESKKTLTSVLLLLGHGQESLQLSPLYKQKYMGVVKAAFKRTAKASTCGFPPIPVLPAAPQDLKRTYPALYDEVFGSEAPVPCRINLQTLNVLDASYRCRGSGGISQGFGVGSPMLGASMPMLGAASPTVGCAWPPTQLHRAASVEVFTQPQPLPALEGELPLQRPAASAGARRSLKALAAPPLASPMTPRCGALAGFDESQTQSTAESPQSIFTQEPVARALSWSQPISATIVVEIFDSPVKKVKTELPEPAAPSAHADALALVVASAQASGEAASVGSPTPRAKEAAGTTRKLLQHHLAFVNARREESAKRAREGKAAGGKQATGEGKAAAAKKKQPVPIACELAADGLALALADAQPQSLAVGDTKQQDAVSELGAEPIVVGTSAGAPDCGALASSGKGNKKRKQPFVEHQKTRSLYLARSGCLGHPSKQFKYGGQGPSMEEAAAAARAHIAAWADVSTA